MDEDVNLSQIPNPTTSIFRKLWRSYSRDRQSNKDDEPPRYLVKPKSIPIQVPLFNAFTARRIIELHVSTKEYRLILVLEGTITRNAPPLAHTVTVRMRAVICQARRLFASNIYVPTKFFETDYQCAPTIHCIVVRNSTINRR